MGSSRCTLGEPLVTDIGSQCGGLANVKKFQYGEETQSRK